MTTKTFSLVCLTLFLVQTIVCQPKSLEMRGDESSMRYRIVHPLHKIEASSKEVKYRLEADPAMKKIYSVTAEVDVTTYDSGNSNRDSHAMEVIDAITYPEASFSSTSIVQDGDSVDVAGKLTFHGITRDILIKSAPTWSESRLRVVGDFAISLTDFKIERPSLLFMPVEDTLRFSFVAVFGIQ